MSIEKNIRVNKLLDLYGSLLTEKQRDMLTEYYANDYSLAEISEIKGISRQGVLDSIRQGTDALERYEFALGLYSKILRIESLKDENSELVGKILDVLED